MRQEAKTLSVLDTSTNSVAATVPLETRGFAIAIIPLPPLRGNPPTNVESTLDSIEQALNRHGVIPFSTPTPGVRLL